MEYFQDDIYPVTRVTWQPALTAQEWLDGGNEVQSCVSLRPVDMKPCETNTYTSWCLHGGNCKLQYLKTARFTTLA